MGSYTDRAGRLYALVIDAAGSASLVVVNGRDGSSIGSRVLGPIDPGGFVVDERGRVYVADRLSQTVEIIDPDGDFSSTTSSAPDPRAMASWTDFNQAAQMAVVSTSAASVTRSSGFDPSDSIALPAGGAPVAASFSRDGGLLAIARDDGTPDVVIADVAGNVVSIAYAASLSSPDACAAGVDDVEFARFGTDNPWYALDLDCDHLYVGGATQSTAGTVALGSSGAPALPAGGRLQIDGWTNVAWLSDGAGVKRVTLANGSVAPVVGVPGAATSIALAQAGTLLWVASVPTGEGAVLTQVASAGGSSPFAVLSGPGSTVRDLAYADRPPRVTAPTSVSENDCGSGTNVTFDVTAADPDGDAVYVSLSNPPPDSSFDGVTFTGTFSDTTTYGPDETLRFDTVSGYFWVQTTVPLYIDACPTPTPTPHYSDTEADDGGWDFGWTCECRCAVAEGPQRNTSAGASVTAALLTLLAMLRRRRE